MQASTSRPTVPAPAFTPSPEVLAYLAAQERVRQALQDQARAIAALRELDSKFPAFGGAL